MNGSVMNRRRRPLSKRLVLAVVGVLAVAVSSCCSDAQLRFWQVRDQAGGATAYTVDTAGVPLARISAKDVRYVDAAGHFLTVSKPKLVRQLTEAEWTKATSGARYSLFYCTRCQGCWAKARQP